MLTYPNLNPIALQVGPLKVYWYGIMYIVGFIAAWLLALYRAKENAAKIPSAATFTTEEISDLIFYCVLGVIVGGRVGFVLFYYFFAHGFAGFFADPFFLFKIWEGGMSFHGGLIGVAISMLLFAKRTKKHFLDIADFVAPLVPIGLFLGRIGNFINSELWGRVTNMPWGIVYPNGGPFPRHPSQIYEAVLEGIVLFSFLWVYSSKKRARGKVAAWFLIGYGLARFICEFFRAPDQAVGFVAFNWLTTGHIFSLPMLLVGGWMLIHCSKSKPKPKPKPKSKSQSKCSKGERYEENKN